MSKHSNVSMLAFDAAINTLESVVDAHRGDIFHNYEIEATLRQDAHYSHAGAYDGGLDYRAQVKIKYIVRGGRSYVKVLWRPDHLLKSDREPEFYREEDKPWVEIADHDTCWRGCEAPIRQWIRENLQSAEKWDEVFPFYNCERVTIKKSDVE